MNVTQQPGSGAPVWTEPLRQPLCYTVFSGLLFCTHQTWDGTHATLGPRYSSIRNVRLLHFTSLPNGRAHWWRNNYSAMIGRGSAARVGGIFLMISRGFEICAAAVAPLLMMGWHLAFVHCSKVVKVIICQVCFHLQPSHVRSTCF